MKSTSRREFLVWSLRGSLALGGTALLAACGGGAATSAPASSATSAPAAPTSAAAAAPTSGGAAAAPTTVAAATSAPAAAGATAAPAAAVAGAINVYIGGDVNIRDLWSKQLIPAYNKVKPDVQFNMVFDEHALGEQAVFDRLSAAKQAGKPSGVDLWEASRLPAAGEAGMVEKLDATKIPNLSKVPKGVLERYNSFGFPYRASSVVLAYNSAQVKDPPKTLDDVLKWAKANDGQFTYNPPDKGGSGGNFVTRVLKVGIPQDQIDFFQTQYDPSKENLWEQGWGVLKDLGPHIYNNGFYPQGNVPVLQTLGKGSISMAPVWSDQGLSYLAQKLLPAEVKLTQIDPPFGGSAAYLGVGADSQLKPQIYDFLNWLLTPEPQTVIVTQINGYPGLDWQYMPQDVQAKYADIAKTYSYDFSPKFGTDRNKLWYEQVAGTPQPTPGT